MNKLYSLCALAVAAFGLTTQAMASDTQVGGIYYNFDAASQTAEVTYKGQCRCGGSTYQGAVVIPQSVSFEGKTYAVTSIGEYAFSSCPKLESVVVPTSVKSVGYFAFAGSRVLTEVRFAEPAQVESIGRMAFLACKALPGIEIPQSVKEIGSYCFEMCDALNNVRFAEPSSLKEIGDYVFCHTGLDHLVIPSSVERVSDVAFCSNPNLVNVVLPKNVTSISARNPFCYNAQTTSMVVEEGNPVYDSRKECNAIIETKTNTLVAGCVATKIPASVTALGRSSFNHCTTLTDANLPATIRSIGKYAYLGCTGLKSFYFPSTMTMMADSVFWQATNLDSVVVMTQRPFTIDESDFEPTVYQHATLYVPAGTKGLYAAAPAWSKFQKIVEMPRFVVGGVTYDVVEPGKAVVAEASEGVPYEGTVVVPSSVKSGSETFAVVGVGESASASANASGAKLVFNANAAAADADNIAVYGQKGFIKIEGTDAEAQVFYTNGLMMKSTTERIIRAEQGIYLVKVGGKTAKVVVE